MKQLHQLIQERKIVYCHTTHILNQSINISPFVLLIVPCVEQLKQSLYKLQEETEQLPPLIEGVVFRQLLDGDDNGAVQFESDLPWVSTGTQV